MSMTIRGRLTIWYTLAFCAALLLVVGVLAIELYYQLNSEIRRALRTEENWITMMGENEFANAYDTDDISYDSLGVHLNHEMDERYGLKQQFSLFSLKLHPGKIYVSGGVKDVERLLPLGFLQWRADNYDLTLAGDHYRVRLFRRKWGAVAVGVQNETVFEVAEEAGIILIWIVPLCILLAIAGGWLMAKLALRPVVAAAKKAESISMANLEERLPPYLGKDEFGTLAATLNRMIGRLEQGVKRLHQFTQDAAHELRTPLAILRADVELAYQDENFAKEKGAWLQRVLDRVIALGQIVDNLMLLARSDSGAYPLHKTSFRLDGIIKEISDDLKLLAEDRPVTIHFENYEVVEFSGDEQLIRRLLLNLCENALNYTSQGKITISIRKADKNVELVVSDTGKGIPSTELPYIFDRFHRVDKARSGNTRGCGLGLAICDWIVKAHNGKIEITSEVEKGTTVRVLLPGTSEKESERMPLLQQ